MSYYEDEIYHSAYSDGYLDGYYAGMELYHSDDSEMTEEERKARRKKRRRNIALGVAGVAGAGAAGYAIARGLRKRGRGIVPSGFRGSNGPRPTGGSSGPRLIGGPTGGSSGPSGSSGSRPRGPKPTGPRLTGPTLKRVEVNPREDIEIPIGWDHRRNKPKYRSDDRNAMIYRDYKSKKKYEEWDGDNNKLRELYNEFARDHRKNRRW